MTEQELLQQLNSRGRAFDPFEDVIGRNAPAPQGQTRPNTSMSMGDTFQKEGILGLLFEAANRGYNIPSPMQAGKSLAQMLGSAIGGESLMGAPTPVQSPTQRAQYDSQTPLASPSIDLASIGGVIKALDAAKGVRVGEGSEVVNTRGSFSRSNPVSSKIENANRDARRQIEQMKAGKTEPSEDELIRRSLLDALIGTSDKPGFASQALLQDPRAANKIGGRLEQALELEPEKPDVIKDKPAGMSWEDWLGSLIAGGAIIVGAKGLGKRRAKKLASK